MNELQSLDMAIAPCASNESLNCVYTCHNDSSTKTYMFSLTRASYISGMTLLFDVNVNITGINVFNDTILEISRESLTDNSHTSSLVEVFSRHVASLNGIRIHFTRLLEAKTISFNLTIFTQACFTLEVHASPLTGNLQINQ